jgi:hypothetical protein
VLRSAYRDKKLSVITFFSCAASSGVRRAGRLHPLPRSQPISTKQLPVGYGQAAVGLHTRFQAQDGHGCPRNGLRSASDRQQQGSGHDGCSEMPSGSTSSRDQHLGGYNQRDAVILNKTSAERGLFASTYYNTSVRPFRIRSQERKSSSTYRPKSRSSINHSTTEDHIDRVEARYASQS